MEIAVVDPSSFSLPYDHHLCRGLAELGHDVTLYCGQRSFYVWDEATYTVRQFFYRGSERVGDKLPDAAAAAVKGVEHVVDSGRLVKQVTTADPDVVHVQWAPVPLVDTVAARLYGRTRPVVHTVHNAEPLHGGGNPLQRIGADRAREAFDALIAHTEVTRERLREQEVGTPVSVVPHPALGYADLAGNRTYPDVAGVDIDGAKNVLLCFGSLRPYKNPEGAIRALAALPAALREGTVLLFVGAPRMDIDRLRGTAGRLEVADRVRWDLRYVPDEVVPAVFRAADVTLLPYTDIDQSGVMMTSLGLGTPVVAAAVGGFPETIEDGVHGRLYEPGNSNAAAEAVAEVLSWPPEESATAIERLVADRYTPERVAARTVAVYESL